MMVKDISPGPLDSFPQFLTNVNGTLYFEADDGIHGDELWKSNGTAVGTVMVRDMIPGSDGSDPSFLAAVNGPLNTTPSMAQR
jgi:ELWxxDGT repeat protein